MWILLALAEVEALALVITLSLEQISKFLPTLYKYIITVGEKVTDFNDPELIFNTTLLPNLACLYSRHEPIDRFLPNIQDKHN